MGHSGQVGGSLQQRGYPPTSESSLNSLIPRQILSSVHPCIHHHHHQHQGEKYIRTSALGFWLAAGFVFRDATSASRPAYNALWMGHLHRLRAGCLSTDTLSQTCITWEALKESLRSRVSVDKKEKKKKKEKKGKSNNVDTTQEQHREKEGMGRKVQGRKKTKTTTKKKTTGIHEWGKFRVGFWDWCASALVRLMLGVWCLCLQRPPLWIPLLV